MYTQRKKEQPSIFKLLLTIVGVCVVGAFGAISFSTGDLLWFYWDFNETPESITLNCYGEVQVLNAEDAEFAQLNNTFNEIFSGEKNWDSLSMSPDTWQEYQTGDLGITLIMQYPEPMRIHSMYKYFSHVEKLIIPVDGRHANKYAVFGITGDNPSAGSLHVSTVEPLKANLAQQGLCQAKMVSVVDTP